MKHWTIGWSVCAALLLVAVPGSGMEAEFDENFVGPDACGQCHRAELDVWENSQHFATFRELPRHPDISTYLEAIDGENNIRRDPVCSTCHFTQISVRGRPPRPVAGPSCESCHGAAAGWIDVHNDYGGAGASAGSESEVHRRERFERAKEAGMIWSFMHYDIAANCMECHGLANHRVGADLLAKLHEAGHPLKQDFEFVRFSQGSVRHRFYPPDITLNSELPPAGLARFYLLGQAAQYAAATTAAEAVESGTYHDAQVARRESARGELQPFADIAEVAAFLEAPTDVNGRKLADALKAADLSGRVADRLPAPDTYK